MSDRNDAHGVPNGVGFSSAGAGYEEEQPTYTSVAVRPHAPSLGPLKAGLFGKAPPTGLKAPAFGKAPSIGLPKPAGGLKTSRKSFSVAQEWTGVTLWDVRSEHLDAVPVDFPLERTHREINCDPSLVATRISECLRLHSIDAKYDNENARAKCKTADYVKFKIRLYAGGENGQPVVVEVQKRSGSSSSFVRCCRAVLDSAEGKTDANAAAAPKRLGPPMKMPVRDMDCLKSVPPMKSSPDEDAAAAFDSAATLCKSKQRDSVLLGLQSLCCVTDPLQTSPLVAIRVSKWILLGDQTHDIREVVSTMLLKDLAAEDPEDDPSDLAGQQRHHALLLIANALDMCAKDGCLSEIVRDSEWCKSQLVPSLLKTLKDAEASANNAYVASRSACMMISSSDNARRWIAEGGGAEALKEAHTFSIERHDLLTAETRQCFDLLENPL